MSVRTITESPAVRNQRIFLAAVAAGSRVVRSDSAGYHVSSKTTAGKTYAVRLTIERATGAAHFHCNCAWSYPRPVMSHDTGALPCAHILIVKAFLMDADDLLAVSELAPAMGAVLAAVVDRASAATGAALAAVAAAENAIGLAQVALAEARASAEALAA